MFLFSFDTNTLLPEIKDLISLNGHEINNGFN